MDNRILFGPDQYSQTIDAFFIIYYSDSVLGLYLIRDEHIEAPGAMYNLSYMHDIPGDVWSNRERPFVHIIKSSRTIFFPACIVTIFEVIRPDDRKRWIWGGGTSVGVGGGSVGVGGSSVGVGGGSVGVGITSTAVGAISAEGGFGSAGAVLHPKDRDGNRTIAKVVT